MSNTVFAKFFFDVFDPLIVVLIFPFVILLCANANNASNIGLIKNIKNFLGDISFPIYIIHYPTLLIMQPFIENEAAGWLLMLLCIFLSIFVARYVDSPMRIAFKKFAKLN